MSPPPDRRSSPGLPPLSVANLYPTALDSDPSELAKQTTELFMQHARKHDQHVTHFSSINSRLTHAEGVVNEMATKIGELERGFLKGVSDLKQHLDEGFADVKLERTKDRTKQSTALAAVGVGWAIFMALCGGAAWYLSRPSCKPDEAEIGGRCVQVKVVVKAE